MRRLVARTVPAVGVVAFIVGAAVVGRTAQAPPQPEVVATMKPDSGAGELQILVVGGVFDSRAGAQAANRELRLGEMQGYYVVPVAQFQGFGQQIGRPGDFALVSAFRTKEGAAEFARVMIAAGHPATILPERVRSLGGVYAGLGQEAAPDGSGPLVGPIPAPLP